MTRAQLISALEKDDLLKGVKTDEYWEMSKEEVEDEYQVRFKSK